MNAVVRNGHWYFTTNYVYNNDSNCDLGRYIEGFEYDLLRVVLERMNMSFVHVHKTEGSEKVTFLYLLIYLKVCLESKFI
jgi:hypothetical protein